MIKNISILGSTGSIGTQALEVVEDLGNINIYALSANTRIDLLEQQIRKYKPIVAAVMDTGKAQELRYRIKDTNTRVVAGLEGFVEIASLPQVDMVLTSVVGVVGLIPTLEAIRAKKDIALANKETLVTAGEMIMKEAKKQKVAIIPVDSEHSAIFQCLQQKADACQVKRIILTASGGPFLGKKLNELENVTPEQALKHPNWNMGNKISIDSATLMNKGLEVIEAKWLFNIDIEKIEVLVHPQSIIHSMVEFVDHSILAQLGVPDMKIPIQYALTYPERQASKSKSLNFMENHTLSFSKPDLDTFKCLSLAYYSAKQGGTMPVVLNGANEMAVKLFLKGKIRFLQIAEIIEKVMMRHCIIMEPSLEDILNSDEWARETVLDELSKI